MKRLILSFGIIEITKKIFVLIEENQRKSIPTLIILTTIGTILEVFSVALIIPALMIIFSPGEVLSLPILGDLFSSLDIVNTEDIIIIGLLGLILFFLLKEIYLIFWIWVLTGFVYRSLGKIGEKLLENYLNQPYSFHLKTNSSLLTKNIINETLIFAEKALFPAIILVSEFLILFGIGVFLFFLYPLGSAIVLSIFSFTSIIFHRLSGYRLLRWGEIRTKYDGSRMQSIMESLGGIKITKLLGNESFFLKRFSESNNSVVNVARKQLAVANFPRYWFELVAVISLITFVFFLSSQDKNIINLLSAIGLFTVAAFRAMPSLNRLITSVQSIVYAIPSIELLYKEVIKINIKDEDNSNKKSINFEKKVEFKNVSFTYENESKSVLDNINFEIIKGSTVAIIGPSGAGKSTLVDLLLGLIEPSDGNILVDGDQISNSLNNWQQNLGYVPQRIYISDDSLKSNIAYGVSNEDIDIKRVEEVIRLCSLEQFVNNLPNGINTSLGEKGIKISGGQLQRIGIARALYIKPKLLVLDEATSALDYKTESEVMNSVNKIKGITKVIVSHRLTILDQFTKTFELNNGNLKEVIRSN